MMQPIAPLAIVFAMETVLNAQEPADTNYDESKVPEYELPPLFAGEYPTAAPREVWESSRRSEILQLFEQHMYGRVPSGDVDLRIETLERDTRALDGLAVRRQLRLHLSTRGEGELETARSIAVDVLIYAPAGASAAVPAFLGLNFFGNHTVHPDPAILMNEGWMRANDRIGVVGHRATEATRGTYASRWQVPMLLQRGYALVTAYCGDLDPDNYRHDYSDGAQPLFYDEGQTKPAGDEWGTIGVWAWGLSKIREALEGDSKVDADRIAVMGHSRLGKTALWAGARDPKFAMVISNNSGCGGAALFRRCFGERIHHMLKPIGYWFCLDFPRYARREADLPVDQHMLLALVAPRPLYVASATNDRWADPLGEFLAAKHAGRAYQLYGHDGLPTLRADLPPPNQPIVGRVGYHLREGDHDVKAYDWEQYLAFADRHLGSRDDDAP